MNTSKFETMGKLELRAACKDAGIKYGKLDNAGMRAALETAATPTPAAAEVTAPVVAPVVVTPVVQLERRSSDHEVSTVTVEPASDATQECEEGSDHCPAPTNVLGAMFGQLSLPMPVLAPITSVQVIDGRRVVSKVTPHVHTRSTDVVIKTPAPERERVVRNGYTIEKAREEKNGVKRPSVGTTCSAIWAHFDANPTTQAKNLDGIADSNTWDRTTVHVQFYVWRKFNGIRGRQS